MSMTSPGESLDAAVAEALSTTWSRDMGLRLPIVGAPMGGVAGGRLAAAVSGCGGLGMIGMGTAGSVVALRRELGRLDGFAGLFGIGLVDWVFAAQPELLEVAIAAKPALISVSFGTDLSWAPRVRDSGIHTATQIYTVDDALRAEDAGIDVLVARGMEGGGHGAVEMATLPLLDAVLGAVTVPVLAAGGIGSPASLAAVLTAGASGAWLGTRLAACEESLLSSGARAAMLAARGADTVLTRAFDVGMGFPWPSRFPLRALRNEFADRWTGREDELSNDDTARETLRAGIVRDDPSVMPVDAGQGVGLVTAVEPAAQVIEALCDGAARILNR